MYSENKMLRKERGEWWQSYSLGSVKYGDKKLSAKIPLDHPPPTPLTKNKAVSEEDAKPMDD